MSDPERLTLVLRYADVGIATYASLRIVGQPSRTVAWVIEEPILLTAIEELADALSPRTAMVYLTAGGPSVSGPLSLENVAALAKPRNSTSPGKPHPPIERC